MDVSATRHKKGNYGKVYVRKWEKDSSAVDIKWCILVFLNMIRTKNWFRKDLIYTGKMLNSSHYFTHTFLFLAFSSNLSHRFYNYLCLKQLISNFVEPYQPKLQDSRKFSSKHSLDIKLLLQQQMVPRAKLKLHW